MIRSKLLRHALAAAALAMSLAGCATQNYPAVPALSLQEASAMDCRQLASDQLRLHSLSQALVKSTVTDPRVLASLSIDLGLGNFLALANAHGSITDRVRQVELAMAAKRCPRSMQIRQTFQQDAVAGVRGALVDTVSANPLVHSVGNIFKAANRN